MTEIILQPSGRNILLAPLGALGAATLRSRLGLPRTTVDNTVPRFDGVSGAMQTSGVTISDTNDITGVAALTCSGSLSALNLRLVGSSGYLTPAADATLYDVLRASGIAGPAIQARWDSATANRYLDLGHRDNAGTFFSLLRLENGQRVLIGAPTDDGATRLQMNGSAKLTTADARFDLVGTKAGGNNWFLQTVDSDGRFRIYDQTTNAERLAIALGTGVVTMGAGISFGNETLSTYDEGTWTPTLRGSGTAGSHTYSQQVGRYVRIGKVVICQFAFRVSSKDAAMAGNLTIGGLPFPVKNLTDYYSSGNIGYVEHVAWTNQLALYAGFGVSVANLADLSATAGGASTLLTAASAGANPYLIGTITYEVD